MGSVEIVDIRRCQSPQRLTKIFLTELYRDGVLDNVFRYWLDHHGRRTSLDALLSEWFTMVLNDPLSLEIYSTGFTLFPKSETFIPFHIVPRRLLACLLTLAKQTCRSRSQRPCFQVTRVNHHTVRLHNFRWQTLLDDRADKSRWTQTLVRVSLQMSKEQDMQGMIADVIQTITQRLADQPSCPPYVRKQLLQAQKLASQTPSGTPPVRSSKDPRLATNTSSPNQQEQQDHP